MRRRSKLPPLPVIIASVVFFGVVFYLVNTTGSKPAPAVTVKESIKYKAAPRTDVLVAANDIPLGERLTKSHFAWRAWPNDLLQPEYITRDSKKDRIQEIINFVTKSAFISGEPIIRNKMIDIKNGSIIAGLLRDGMRAYSIRISQEAGQSAFIKPGDYVDLLYTTTMDTPQAFLHAFSQIENAKNKISDQPKEKKNVMDNEIEIIRSKKQNNMTPDKNMMSEASNKNTNKEEKEILKKIFKDRIHVSGSNQLTEVFMKNVRVLAVDQNLSSKEKEADPNSRKRSNTISILTVEVTLEQTKLLTWASRTGQLTFVLRSFYENIHKAGGAENIFPEVSSKFFISYQELLDEEDIPDTGEMRIIRSSRYNKVKDITSAKTEQDEKDD